MEISEIKPGDLLFVWGHGLIESSIEFITHGASHCALFLDSETLAEAQGGRTTGKAYLSDYLATNDRLEVWRDTTLTDDEREKIVEYAQSHFDIGYDYIAILADFIRFELDIPLDELHEGKKRICSSYVNDCAMSVGHNWSAVSYAPAPVDLMTSKKLTRIGRLK